jgi:hypothetical protein
VHSDKASGGQGSFLISTGGFEDHSGYGAMKKEGICKVILIVVLMSVSAAVSYGQEIKTQYATIVYDGEEQIAKFNEMSLGRITWHVNSGQTDTSHEEIKEKLDAIVERVESMLHLFLPDLKFQIILLSSVGEVQSIYESKYGISVQYLAFYSPRDKTLFISAADINLHILAHELSHVIIDHYFDQPAPAVIHEAVAQYVDSHIDD